jgi:putative DNA methylase
MDRILDDGLTGPRFLGTTEIANMVVDAIRYRDFEMGHYRLRAFVAMPNHVHVLMTPLVDGSKVMQSIKRFTAREANRIPGRTGAPFWQDENYDRLVRDEAEFNRIARYIEWNPVKAGLAARPEAFRWSSAWAD